MRRRVRRAALLLALAVGLSSCGLSLQALPKPGGISGGTYALKAVFANVLNLPLQARVLIGSDQVGQVTSIATLNFKADLTLAIKHAVRIPVGTTAQILFVDPLGDEFIELQPPAGKASGPYLAAGATLPERQTSSAPSIPDTLAALGTLLNGGGLNQLQTIVTQLNQALDGHQAQIREILTGLSATADSLNANKGSIDNALSGLAALSGELAKGDAAIANGIDTIGPAVGVLASENSDFDKLLASANQLSLVATSTVQTSSASFLGTIHQLDAVLNQMVGVESQLGPTLTDLARFEAMTPRVAPGDYLQLSLNGTVTINQTPLLGASNVAGPTGPVTAASGASNDAAIRGLLGAGLP